MATLFYPPHNGIIQGRKRRLSEDEDMGDAHPFSFNNHDSNAGARHSLDRHRRSSRDNTDIGTVKRYKSGIQKRTATAEELATLDKEKLIDLIQTLLDAHPEIKHDIMTHIPAPTIDSATSVLNSMEKRLTDSFPYNRHGPSRNDYTFSRVRGPLMELVETVLQYAAHFTSEEVFPSTSFAFLERAAHVAHRLPVWENQENNQLKKDLYRALGDFWKQTIQQTASKLREGETYSQHIVSEWAKNLAEHNSYTGGIFSEAVHEFSKRLGFMIGLPHNETPREVPICHHPAVESNLAGLSPSSRVVGYADLYR